MKVITKSNYRVIIEPNTGHYFFRRSQEEISEEEKKICKEIEDQVRRHVDNFSRVDIDCDTDITCSYCKLAWEVDKETGEPFCCSRAVEEWETEKQKAV